MFFSKTDPIVDDAVNKRLICGAPEELEVLARFLTNACDNSEIARNVIYQAISRRIKVFVCDELAFSGIYKHKHQCICLRKSLFHYEKSDINQILAISVLVHEMRHGCQYSLIERSKNRIHLYSNWVNTIMHTCLGEADARAFEIAAMYQLSKNFGIAEHYALDVLNKKTEFLYGLFAEEYEQKHNILNALEWVTRAFNMQYGDSYKSLCIKNNWCRLENNAVTIHPNEWIQHLNISYKNTPYMNIEKVTEECLLLNAKDYEQIKQNLDKAQQTDDSIEYFSAKVPDESDDSLEKHKIIPARKHFIF